MSDPEQQSCETVDRLVRAYLDHETEQTDATALRERLQRLRVQAELEDTTDIPAVAPAMQASNAISYRHWRRRLAWSATAVLAVVAAFVGGRQLGPEIANAATVLRGVKAVHSEGVDRCYRVQYTPDPRFWNKERRLEGPSHSILWTRGDRFWSDCTIGDDIQLKIGREADGTLWVSPQPNKGIQFTNDASQLPAEVAMLSAVNSMTVPALVDDVLADFHLRVDGPATHADGRRTLIWARLQPGRSHPSLSAALLEIDAESNVLVRLVLWMVRDGQPRGTVTFTLLDSAPQGDEVYRLESHLDADAKIEHHTLQKAESGEPDWER